MAVEKRANTVWQGNLVDGKGTIKAVSGAFDLAVTWPRRAEQGPDATSPEELIAGAHAACFSMALSHGLTQRGYPPDELRVEATVGFQAGEGLLVSRLSVIGRVPGIDVAAFEEAVDEAVRGCPVSRALAGIEITHSAALES